MVTPADFIRSEYTPDLTQAGIAYACRSLPFTYDRMGGSFLKRLRRIAAGVAVELAFRRLLGTKNIPHDSLGTTPFTDPDRYDIAIGGRRCDIKSFSIQQKKRISQINKFPRTLLDAQALVPADQIKTEKLIDDDIYVFSFLNALITPNRQTLIQALDAHQPAYLIHALPKDWSRAKQGKIIGQIIVKSDFDERLKLEFGGLDTDQKFFTEQVMLEPKVRTRLKSKFHTLSYLYCPKIPTGILGVYGTQKDETHLVNPAEWGNIWVYGMQIYFVGYMTRGEFREKAFRLPAGSRVFQYPRTRTENFSLPIGDLHPLVDLFSRAQSWQKR
jgi:hypothetical protein